MAPLYGAPLWRPCIVSVKFMGVRRDKERTRKVITDKTFQTQESKRGPEKSGQVVTDKSFLNTQGRFVQMDEEGARQALS